MDIQGIFFSIIKGDSHLISPLASVDKKSDESVPAATRLEGDIIRYNPAKLDEMGEDGVPQIMGDIVHLSLLHMERRKATIAGIKELEPVFDIAADLATYHNITDSKKFINPKDMGLKEGLSAEEYFTLVMDKVDEKKIDLNQMMQELQGQGQGQPQQGQGQGEPQDGEGEGEGGGDGESQAKAQNGKKSMSAYDKLLEKLGVKGKHSQDHSQWNQMSMPAQHNAKAVLADALNKSRGNLPAGLKRLLKHLVDEPQVRWTDRLRNLVGNKVAATKKKYTMMRPSRRFGVPHPGQKRIRRGLIAAHIDTSGSMSEVDIAIGLVELKGIADAYGAPFQLMIGDCKIESVERITGKMDIDKVQIKGGGGTSHVPVFKWLEEQALPVDLLICITDLYTEFPSQEPEFPVIWVTATKDAKPPFGEVLLVEQKDLSGEEED